MLVRARVTAFLAFFFLKEAFLADVNDIYLSNMVYLVVTKQKQYGMFTCLAKLLFFFFL